MAITLAESKVGMSDHVEQAVVDEFRRGSYMLDHLTFDNAVSPGTGGSTLVYGYTQLLTPSTAGFREINTEYTSNEAKRTKKKCELKIFGGRYSVDRVIQETSGSTDELSFQLQQKIKAASNGFNYMIINGNSAANSGEFDGLDVLVTGSSTEYKERIGLDISDSNKLDDNYKTFLDALDEFLSGLDGKPSVLCGNSKLITKIKACARRAGYYTRSENSFGQTIGGYDGIPLIDLEEYYNGTASVPVIPVYDSETKQGLTDLYAVTLGLDAFHAVSPAGGKIIRNYLPDMSQPGAIKTGEVEMVAGVALKNSRKAGVFRGIKVKPTTAVQTETEGTGS